MNVEYILLFKCFVYYYLILQVPIIDFPVKYIDNNKIKIPKTCNSNPLNGKYINAKGNPIKPNKNAPQVGQPTPNAAIPEPMNPNKPCPFIFLFKLNLKNIIDNNIPDKLAVINIATTLKVTKLAPDIITEIQMSLSAILATKR